MVNITNSEIMQEIRNRAKLQGAVSAIPAQLGKEVIPTIEVNPQMVKNAQIVRSGRALNSTAVTIYTTPTDQDFYLTSAAISFIKDVTSTSTVTDLRVFINGSAQTLLRFDGITLTVQTGSVSMTFPHPIKIDRGSIITINNGTNTATIAGSGMIVGFIDESSNG